MNLDELHPEARALFNTMTRPEHTVYPQSDWKYEVANDDTTLGYWDWLSRQLEARDYEARALERLASGKRRI